VSGGNTQPHSRIELPRSAPILTRRKRARLETSERERNGRDPNRKLRKRRPPTQYQPPTQLSHRHSSATDTAQPPTQLRPHQRRGAGQRVRLAGCRCSTQAGYGTSASAWDRNVRRTGTGLATRFVRHLGSRFWPAPETAYGHQAVRCRAAIAGDRLKAVASARG
jgi:hypothetical protein